MTVAVDKQTTWMAFGASVRGPAHRAASEANQDAWLSAAGAYGSLVVVCDGMGSRPQARRGAKAACLAVKDAVRAWSRSEEASPLLLLRLIHVLWSIRIAPAAPGDCVTTCLFALALPDGRMLLAQLGDGLAAQRMPSGEVEALSQKGSGFGNQTTGLGAAKDLDAWSWRMLPPGSDGTSVLLATDGISDDLHPDQLGDLIVYLVDQYGCQAPTERWRRLCRELSDWPTPHHLDDKTLAVLWQARSHPFE